MRKFWVLLLLLLPQVARAELYSYVDANGDIHFTNLRPKGAEAKTDNTFSLQDEAGVLRRAHRVDVTRFDDVIFEAAAYYSLPGALIKAVVAVESGFEPRAVSPKGAMGLMQLMPETAKLMSVPDIGDPTHNVYGGVRYLRILANRFKGDVQLTLAGYNAGPDLVEKVGGVPDIPETRAYVRRVLVLYRHYLGRT